MKNNFTSECNVMFGNMKACYNMLSVFYHRGALETGRNVSYGKCELLYDASDMRNG